MTNANQTLPDGPVDLLVIGTGIAGCTAALKAGRAGFDVLLVTRSRDLLASSTGWAQGGIIYEGERDSTTLLVDDIIEAGADMGNRPAIEVLAEEGPQRVREMLLEREPAEGGIPFDRDSIGGLSLTEEAAHSVPRIIHVDDLTGRAIQDFLLDEVRREPRIQTLTSATAIDLLTLSHHGDQPEDRYAPPTCTGAYVLLRDEQRVVTIRAKETVLATGGCGQLYLHTTNPPGARGDGISMSWRAGVRLSHMEYVQFHPTALYTKEGRRFLISEAVRGEGGRLINGQGEEFMHKYDERGALAPRDIVARAIHEEMLHDGAPCMYLDITHKPADWIKERFPNISRTCLERGIDITKEPIPVVPAAHYMCGGVLVDLEGRSSTRRLWAVGEVSCTGVHGANRLASTSLLEGLVWGARCGEAVARRLSGETDGQTGWGDSNDASGSPEYRIPDIEPWRMATESPDPALIHQDWRMVKYTMWNYVGLVRTRKRLGRARALLRELENEIDEFYANSHITDALIGLRNGVTAARAITAAAMENRKSAGCHYRTD